MNFRRLLRPLVLLAASFTFATAAAPTTLVLEPAAGMAAKGKHVVLLSGDEEYRSEEALPMLAKILSQRQRQSKLKLEKDEKVNYRSHVHNLFLLK